MPEDEQDAPPPEVGVYVEKIQSALARLSRGDQSESQVRDLHQAFDGAIRAAAQIAVRDHGSQWKRPGSATFAQILGENLKALRIESGWSQDRLATAMAALGFKWKRVTCAEVEGTSRRLGLDELMGLAALFGVPAVQLMLPSEGTTLDWTNRDLSSEEVKDLFVGHKGRLGEGGANWSAALTAVGSLSGEDERPAADLWRVRDGRLREGDQSR
jgi:transcriptional regulator with XRE-family HTH domain